MSAPDLVDQRKVDRLAAAVQFVVELLVVLRRPVPARLQVDVDEVQDGPDRNPL
jgi:hypothetical protein